MRDAAAGPDAHRQYHTPHIRLTIEVDGVASVWDWPADALIPMGPRFMPDHTAFEFTVVSHTRKIWQLRQAGQVPYPLMCRDYADGEYLCGLSAQQD
jgi:hypothetical protein